MNPLDLPGPAFLQFYLAFGAIVIALGRLLRGRLQDADRPRTTGRFAEGYYPKEAEAYHIAYLRGGPAEVEQTARVLAETQSPSEAGSSKPAPAPYISDIKVQLQQEGLLYKGSALQPFALLLLAALVLIIGMAVAKGLVALSRGRTNLGFLFLLTIAFSIAAAILLRPPRLTATGKAYLEWAGRAHNGLLSLVNQGRRTTAGEVALCAAIYGLGPISAEPAVRLKEKLKKEAAAAHSSDGGTSGGGCGGSSCGGGCGGGGCGGCGS